MENSAQQRKNRKHILQKRRQGSNTPHQHLAKREGPNQTQIQNADKRTKPKSKQHNTKPNMNPNRDKGITGSTYQLRAPPQQAERRPSAITTTVEWADDKGAPLRGLADRGLC